MKFSLVTTSIILFFTILISNCKKEEVPVPSQVKPSKTSENINTSTGTNFPNVNTVSGSSSGSSTIPNSNTTTTSGNSQNTVNTTSGNNTNPTTSSGTNNNNPPPTTTPSAPISPSYAVDIAPILQNRGCNGCHGYTFATASAEAGPATNVRRILNRINRTQGSTGFMPKNGTKLPQSEINKIQEWFDSGMNQ